MQAVADYTPDPSYGASYTYLMQGEELMVTDVSDSQWWEGYREISADGVLDWEEHATRAFFPRAFTQVVSLSLSLIPRAFTQVVWCECLFRASSRLGITFAAGANSRGRTCYTIHEIDPVACKAHAPKLSGSL